MRGFRKIELKTRPDVLDTLIRAYLSDNAPSRTSICEDTGISKPTASKVASALIDSGFMCERLFSLDGKERPRLHLFLRDSVRILLVDLSSSQFKMSILAGDASVVLESAYNYDSSITFDDNINIFLSRCGLSVKHSGVGFSAISVLYADSSRINNLRQIPLPSIKQKDTISHAILEILGKTPEKHLTISDAICEAVRFNVNCTKVLSGVSYIFVGRTLLAFHAHTDSTKTVCAPERLLTNDETHVLQSPQSSTKESVDEIFIRLCRFMDAAFSPSIIILESDIHEPDDRTAQRISRDFALAGHNPPLISTISAERGSPVHLSGIVRSTVYALVKQHITST